MGVGWLWGVQAIKELNIKAKNWKELLTDEPFTRKDIITLQVCLHRRFHRPKQCAPQR